MAHLHTASSLLAATTVTLGALTAGCAPPLEDVSMADIALTGWVDSFVAFDHVEHTLSLDLNGIDYEGATCPTLDPAAVTLNGTQVPEEGQSYGGSIGPHIGAWGALEDPSCLSVGLSNIDLTPPADDADDDRRDVDEVVIDSGGTRAVWAVESLVAQRRFVAIDPLVNVTRGSRLRFRYEPAADVVTSLEFAELSEDATGLPFDLPARVEQDVIIVTIPGDAPLGAQTLNMTVDVDVHVTECAGFASCDVAGLHFEQIGVWISEGAQP